MLQPLLHPDTAKSRGLEVNFSVITTLQPGHRWSPVLGIIWSLYF